MQSWYLHRSALVPLGLALGLSACFDSHDDEDGGPEASVDDSSADAARIDAQTDGSTCERLGGYRTCSPLCDEPCGSEGGLEHFCDAEFFICRPFEGARACAFARNAPEFPGIARSLYCYDGSLCAVVSEAEISPDRTVGSCVSAEFCREGADAGIDVICVYSDLSRAAGPAAPVSCPPMPHAGLGFCGGPCPGCSWDIWPTGVGHPSCAGVNGTRAFGVCSFFTESSCYLGDPSPISNDDCRRLVGGDCACLLLRGPDGDYPEVGFTTLRTTCLEYRRQFPEGGVDCFDIESWASVPE